ncbi:MAG: hypothetical protein IPI73_12390 [Betaproteobacteria bacterium]|nr:hypothetical protein [Betaproteobacteria bacterium]
MQPRYAPVEGDASRASYFWRRARSRAAGRRPGPGRRVGTASIQGDALAEALEKMGATVTRGRAVWRPAVTACCAYRLDCVVIPDAAMTLAIVALLPADPRRPVSAALAGA